MHEPECLLRLRGDIGFEIDVPDVPIAKGRAEVATFLTGMADVIENHASRMRFDDHLYLIESFAVDLTRSRIRIMSRPVDNLETPS